MPKWTKEQVKEHLKGRQNLQEQWVDVVVNDILKIIYEGKRYPPRRETHEFRIPEDLSTKLAAEVYGVDAYKAVTVEQMLQYILWDIHELREKVDVLQTTVASLKPTKE